MKGHNSFSYLWNFEPIHWMVSEKFFSKNSKFYREWMAHWLFCHPAISQFLMTDIPLKITQIAQLNQLFQHLHLVHIYGHGFYELSRMLMRKSVNNEVSKDSLIRRMRYQISEQWFLELFDRKAPLMTDSAFVNLPKYTLFALENFA